VMEMDRIKHLVVGDDGEPVVRQACWGFLYADVKQQAADSIFQRNRVDKQTFEGVGWPQIQRGPFLESVECRLFCRQGAGKRCLPREARPARSRFLVPDHDPHEEFDHITFSDSWASGLDRAEDEGISFWTTSQTDPGNPEKRQPIDAMLQPGTSKRDQPARCGTLR